MEVLIVDGANVVGSRPDGWWRDRARSLAGCMNTFRPRRSAHDEVVSS